MSRKFEIAPEIAQAALDRRLAAPLEHRLALALPLQEPARDAVAFEDPDGDALVLDRDGNFTRTRY